MFDNNIECYGELVSEVLTAISQVYWGRMYKYIKDNNIDYKDVNCFILNPESMAVYFSKTFIAIACLFSPKMKRTSERIVKFHSLAQFVSNFSDNSVSSFAVSWV